MKKSRRLNINSVYKFGFYLLLIILVLLVGGYFYLHRDKKQQEDNEIDWSIVYNGMVSKDEAVAKQWADVEACYQRRADLIPYLIETVKGYVDHESETLKAVTEARTNATSIKLSVDDLSEENIKKFQEAQKELNSALSRLIAVSENYPDLKANENFRNLQVQLEGTENRINESIKKFNASVQEYNTAVRSFPGNIIAGMAGFKRRSEFKAETGAEKALKVDFSR